MKNIVIWGATTTGKMVYSEIKDKYQVMYFVDGNPKLFGSELFGYTIYGKEQILDERPDIIVMAILTGYEEAVEWAYANGYDETSVITKYVDLNSRARKEFLSNFAEILRIKGITRGEVAELGVYRGDFAKVIHEIFFDKKLYLFDTFEGFPEADFVCDNSLGLIGNRVGAFTDTSVEYVLNKLNYSDKCIVMKGYFPDSANSIDDTFVFVNIDTDLYSSIKAGLEWFWPRMVKGGIILVHDYFSKSYFGARKAIIEFSEEYGAEYFPIGDTLSVAFLKNGI